MGQHDISALVLFHFFIYYGSVKTQKSLHKPFKPRSPPASFITGNSTHTHYCNEDKPESKKREQGSGEGGNTRAVGTSLQPVSSRPNACDHPCKGGLWQLFILGLKGGFASTDLLFTQKCSARPPGSTRLSFRDIIKSSARGLSSHKVDVRTRCHTNAPASPPRHPATTHG